MTPTGGFAAGLSSPLVHRPPVGASRTSTISRCIRFVSSAWRRGLPARLHSGGSIQEVSARRSMEHRRWRSRGKMRRSNAWFILEHARRAGWLAGRSRCNPGARQPVFPRTRVTTDTLLCTTFRSLPRLSCGQWALPAASRRLHPGQDRLSDPTDPSNRPASVSFRPASWWPPAPPTPRDADHKRQNRHGPPTIGRK